MPVIVSDEKLARLVEALKAHNLRLEPAARSIGMAPSTARRYRDLAAKKGMLGTAPVLPGFEISRTTAQTDENGEITRQWVTQKPASDGTFSVPEGHVVKGISALLDGQGNVSAQWVKTRESDTAFDNIEAIREALEDCRGIASIATPPPDSDDDLLTVYTLPDLHLGGRSWGEECGEDWDLEIGCKTVREAVSHLVSQSHPSKHAVVLGLGDFFHANDRTNQTPKSGHILDVDGRWPKVYRAGTRIAADLVSLVSSRHENVEARFLAGNHDPDSAVTLTVALSLFFDGHDRIRIDDSPSMHYYKRFGKVLLGATHGHTMKPENMAMMLAVDRAKDWGESEFRHMFFGHVHHQSSKEVASVVVESFNSPAAKDAYANSGGWRAGRSLVAITFHRTRGEIGRHRINL